jgi:hypothetical protein
METKLSLKKKIGFLVVVLALTAISILVAVAPIMADVIK